MDVASVLMTRDVRTVLEQVSGLGQELHARGPSAKSISGWTTSILSVVSAYDRLWDDKLLVLEHDTSATGQKVVVTREG